jgi:hypothetical protein
MGLPVLVISAFTASALVAVSVIPPFPVNGADQDFMFVVAGVAFSELREESLNMFAPFAESPFLSEALVVQHAQPTTIAERFEFAAAIHPPSRPLPCGFGVG